MSNRLWSDTLNGAGRRFWSSLDSAPGILTPGVATLTLSGQVPVAVEPSTVFRSPATAVLTLQGQSVAPAVRLTPAPAALSSVGAIANELRSLTITPAPPAPFYSIPQTTEPTILFIQTITPAPAALNISALVFNLTQGGNIGFVSPGVGLVTLGTLSYSLLLGGTPDVGIITIVGLAPAILPELTITPDVGLVTLSDIAPDLALPFTWVDDEPATTSAWITDVAA